MPGKIIYTNEQMEADLHEINRQMLHSDFKPDIIVGIARGGLVPATMLSHYHGKPLMIINYSLRDNQVAQNHISDVKAVWEALNQRKKILMVDDICDSGDTLRKVVDELSEGVEPTYFEDMCKVAVLWNNIAQDVFEANYVGREINRSEDDRWILFPYEIWWKA